MPACRPHRGISGSLQGMLSHTTPPTLLSKISLQAQRRTSLHKLRAPSQRCRNIEENEMTVKKTAYLFHPRMTQQPPMKKMTCQLKKEEKKTQLSQKKELRSELPCLSPSCVSLPPLS